MLLTLIAETCLAGGHDEDLQLLQDEVLLSACLSRAGTQIYTKADQHLLNL